MCAPFSQNDEHPDLPEPEAALAALYEAELTRLRASCSLERGRLVPPGSSRDADARLERITANVQRCRIELEQAIIAQATGKNFIGRPSPTLIVEAMQTRQRQNECVVAQRETLRRSAKLTEAF